MALKYFCAAVLALLVCCFVFANAIGAEAGLSERYLVYIGTYTGAKSRGIYSYSYQTSAGKFDSMGLAAESINPSFIVRDPHHHVLYAVNERGGPPPIDGTTPTGSVSTFAIDLHTGQLKFLNKISSAGRTPAHLVIDETGKSLFVAN